jgi:hypothetical protein
VLYIVGAIYSGAIHSGGYIVGAIYSGDTCIGRQNYLVHVHVCVFVHTHIRIYVCIYVYTYMRVYIHKYA